MGLYMSVLISKNLSVKTANFLTEQLRIGSAANYIISNHLYWAPTRKEGGAVIGMAGRY
nr:MAG TPA: hypothetical protein [Caudoviricetes sp.]